MSSQQLWALLWGSYVLDGEQYTAKKMSVETILSVVTVSTLTVHLCKLLWVIGCIANVLGYLVWSLHWSTI